jgi:hypothetical protein
MRQGTLWACLQTQQLQHPITRAARYMRQLDDIAFPKLGGWDGLVILNEKERKKKSRQYFTMD